MKKIIILLNMLLLSVILMGCGKTEVELNSLMSYSTSGLNGTGIVEQTIIRNNLLLAITEAGKKL